ncbi:homodimeric dihydroxyacetone kinase [Salinibacterium amurskyense]|uniref:Homodimeric dihydroxyacetone kinase n=1 Tax=Salinibacterium amurskyense TaxID=205941 RepID=A0A2M9DAG5_9MICO|nr:dihydroxyacetone kinase family protein [Salinibacterium amurskyense]PJJ82588.1 homodimeric dihydroxyacetone kinase [Salinibacterium amurskyense]RLQ82317.1 dihydroxyacetone kinase family protein [Salinibacterium amurskyense]GHD76405.1 erythrulose kinase [Salinibacterium amurskyense]
MTRLWNEPADFANEMVDGFIRANTKWVRKTSGGVARSTRSESPEVAVVIGGGSGHYPAFAGLVGPGLAHGAAMGNLFASPSARQVESVIQATHQGRGVLLSYGNYAGDVMHFSTAQNAARAAGIECRSVVVTDDIFSAPPTHKEKRRGIAGDLTVFKVAGAAAAAGHDLDNVERVALLANERTRTMGVAFSGCTLPGASEPLFSVPEGRMAIGLGIHGEPGLEETDVPTANELSELFVERLLAEAEIPDGVTPQGARVVPVLNGLGSVKNEELFVLFSRIAELLETAGITIVDPQVGEFCTSFDMAGVSLTLFWLNDELEELWNAPANTPAFRTGSAHSGSLIAAEDENAAVADDAIAEASVASQTAAARITTMLSAMSNLVAENADELGRLDSVAGDGDHGIGMQRGVNAAAAAAAKAAERGAGAQTLLNRAADEWSDRAGGTSGALWGVILKSIGEHLGDTAEITAGSVSAGVSAASDAVMAYGGAAVGDKTLVDALVPFATSLHERVAAGDSLAAAWAEAARLATHATERTSDMMPGLGRARSHGEKSLGTPDPGAVSLSLIVTMLGAQLADA